MASPSTDVGGNGEHIVFANSSGDVYYKNGVDAGFGGDRGSGMSRVTVLYLEATNTLAAPISWTLQNLMAYFDFN